MSKQEWADFLKKLETGLGKVGRKAKDLAKELEKDARYGTKIGKLKLNEISLSSQKERALRDIGERIFVINKKKKIADEKIKGLCLKVQKLDAQIKAKKAAINKLQKTLKDSIKGSRKA